MSRPRYDWWGYVKAIIRRYPVLKDRDVSGISKREKDAVQEAIKTVENMSNGMDVLAIIDMVFWKRTHTLSGAALQIPCSERTAQEYHRQFIRLVAKNFGLME